MKKIFELIVVDDNPKTMDPVLKAVKKVLKIQYNYDINYTILSKSKEVEKLEETACDIVMFDCALMGEGYDFNNTTAARYGYELIKEYRKKNRRTKIIFYSGAFDFQNEGTFDLTVKDCIQIINDLNIFAITNREVRLLVDAIKRAIDELDTVLVSLEDLIFQYGENGTFYVDNKEITAENLLKELRMGTPTGEKFREEIYSTIISYFMKFGE